MPQLRRHIPNFLTLLRALAVPYLVWLLVREAHSDGHAYTLGAGIVFAVASITDYIDGVLARRWKVVSKFGKLVDPLADKLIVMAVLVMLAWLDRIEAWVVVIILARDASVDTLRMLAALDGIALAAGQGGKWKTTLQMFGLSFLLVYVPVLDLPIATIGRLLVYGSVVLSITSAVQYFVAYFRSDTPSGTPHAA